MNCGCGRDANDSRAHVCAPPALVAAVAPSRCQTSRRHHVHFDSAIEAALRPVANYQFTAFLECTDLSWQRGR
jgi:hypothetical protein